VLVIFAMTIFVFIGLCAVVVDVAWYWANNLRIQRAADAAALAGVVHLPGDVPTAISVARAEATKNGYTQGVNGFTVTPTQDPSNPRRLRVMIAGPVGTYFAHVLGVNEFPAVRRSRAEFVLPVPMGSPEAYYGVFGTIRGATFTEPQPTTATTDTGDASGCSSNTTGRPSSNSNPTVANPPNPASTWSNRSSADCNNNDTRATSATADGSMGYWGNFGVGLTNSPVQAIDGIEIRARALITGSGTTTSDCRLLVALSWNGGQDWTSSKRTGAGGVPALTTGEQHLTFGNLTTDTWGRSWTASQFDNGNFLVRLEWDKVSCSANRTVSVDTLTAEVGYKYGTTSMVTSPPADIDQQGPGTACVNAAPNCFQPNGIALNDRGFWGTMNTQGADNVDGDAHQPAYDSAGSTTAPVCPGPAGRACYDPDEFYNYAVEMPPGSSNGFVYVFDPGFCATDIDSGTGDRWFSDSGSSAENAVSTWYELLDTNNTPYDMTDDPLLASSDTLFMNLRATDPSMGGPAVFSGAVDCRQRDTQYGDGRDYHNSWWLLNPGQPLSGGAGGAIYRIHTTGTDPRAGGSPGSQMGTNGEQSFSLFVSSSIVGSQGPRIYGLGAMQMFSPLSPTGTGTQSEFYLAQIEAVHAGKTMQIELWDPGDTSNTIPANIQILVPTSGGWVATPMSYTAAVGTSNSSAANGGGGRPNCNTNSGNGVSSIVTRTSGAGTGEFNGCWLTINVQIPVTYTAADPGGVGPGWWKIRYNMTGSGTSSDVTTWKVSIRGNPVHLVVP
jgi:hypothetical protein